MALNNQNIYATRPFKSGPVYVVNLYGEGRLYMQVPFESRKWAKLFISCYDNWDKLCARVPERQPVQGELELVA